MSKFFTYYKVVMNSANDIALLDPTFLSNFYFRGQANADWDLSSSLERMIKSLYQRGDNFDILRRYEAEMLQEFKRKYPLYEKHRIPAEEDNIEWLSIMQHYGACTRLVDATESIFVALFMATQNPFNNTDAAIWAINRNILNSRKYDLYRKNVDKKATAISLNTADAYAYDFANSFIGRYIKPGDCPQQILAIKPKMSNERLSIQQGLFLIPTDISVPFKYNLDNYLPGSAFHRTDYSFNNMEFSKFVEYSHDDRNKANDNILMFKITIPNTLKLGITKLLSQMNISSETLFPGLSGLSQSLNRLRDGYGEYNE